MSAGGLLESMGSKVAVSAGKNIAVQAWDYWRYRRRVLTSSAELTPLFQKALSAQKQPSDLYIAAGDLGYVVRTASDMLAPTVGKSPKRADVEVVRIARMSGEQIQKLIAAGLLENDYEERLESNLRKFRRDRPELQILVGEWEGMSPFHGFLFGGFAFIGDWRVQSKARVADRMLTVQTELVMIQNHPRYRTFFSEWRNMLTSIQYASA